MKLKSPYKILGAVDVRGFDQFLGPHKYWPENDLRSQLFDTHEHTESILFRWTPRDRWPKLTVEEHPAWSDPVVAPLWKAVAYLTGLPEVPPLNFMLAKLKPHGIIHGHFDQHKFFSWAHRIHVPVYVPDGVIFHCADQIVPCVRGQVFELSNKQWHEVENPTDEARYHIVMDFAPCTPRQS